GAGPCRFGVFCDLPHRHKSRLYWTTDDGWSIRQRYLRDTLTTSVALEHKDLKISLYCNDVVDFHRPMMVRKIKVKNLARHERLVRIMHQQEFTIFATAMDDTAYYDHQLRPHIQHRGKRSLPATFHPVSAHAITQYDTYL